jgi:hypothetical protein
VKFVRKELIVTFEIHDMISRLIFGNDDDGFFKTSFIVKSILARINDEYVLNPDFEKIYAEQIADGVKKINDGGVY